MFKGLFPAAGAALMLTLSGLVPVQAQESRISEDRERFEFTLNGGLVSIRRSGAACPPACLQPMQAASGVGTIGELEVMDFLELFVAGGNGLLVDIRLPEGFASGTVPGAVNVPAATLRPGNPYRDDLLNALGVRNGSFSGAFDLVIFGSGADDPEAGEAVRNLLEAGYPTNKLKYYRGGLTAWQAHGLSTATGR